MDRRLAAILAADMYGYSRLMEADEDGVISRQKRHRRELIDPEIERNRGHIVNTTGDGDFDGALKAALTVKLEESPYLNVVPETAVQETLAFMERSPDTRVTQTVAREICQRRNTKAMMLGEIGGLGSRYLITLNAENCQTGESLARQQAEAGSKEEVLEALDATVAEIRRNLGESLASIEATDTPLDQATTSSLEAVTR